MVINKGSPVFLFLCVAVLLTMLGSGCSPKRSVPVEDQPPLYKAPTLLPTSAVAAQPTPTPQTDGAQVTACTDLLVYIDDVTYPDGTEVKPGETIDKQWKVKNGGTCNWDAAYTLQLIGGESLGADSTQALVPARNGIETVISIQFTAPLEEGRYTTQWKAFNNYGQAFGDMLYMDVYVVQE